MGPNRVKQAYNHSSSTDFISRLHFPSYSVPIHPAAPSTRASFMVSPGIHQPPGPVRAFGIQDPAVDPVGQLDTSESNLARRMLRRISFGSFSGSLRSRLRDGDVDSSASTPGTVGRPPVPTVMQASGEVYATSLPILSMIVLSIVWISLLCLRHDPFYLSVFRPCLESSCPLMFPPLSCCLW